MSCDKNIGPLSLWSKDGKKTSNYNKQNKLDFTKRNEPILTSKNKKTLASNRESKQGDSYENKGYRVRLDDTEPPLDLIYSPSKSTENVDVFKHLNKKDRQRFSSVAYTNVLPRYGCNLKNSTKVLQNHSQKKYGIKERENFILVNRNYDKQQFLLANCQFVIMGSELDHLDLEVWNDPDTLLEWTMIEQLILWCHEVPACPICLESPVPAKLTKCGHMYCWPCILHYLDLGDKYWRRCPICFEAIKKEDLKSVRVKLVDVCNPGTDVTFVLMKRPKHSLVCTPAHTDELDHGNHHGEFDSNFAKVHPITIDHAIDDILTPEEEQLLALADDPENISEIAYITDALAILEARRSTLKCKKQSQVNSIPLIDRNTTSNDVPDEVQQPPSECSDPAEPIQAPKDAFYFYQSCDGQALYLHPCDVRMLLEENGGCWDRCPDRLVACRVLEMERHVQTAETRKHFHFLSHLPLFKEYALVEVAMATVRTDDDEPIISSETFDKFYQVLEERAKNRLSATKKMEREELRNQRRIMESGADPYAYFQAYYNQNGTTINLESETDFPSAIPVNKIDANATTFQGRIPDTCDSTSETCLPSTSSKDIWSSASADNENVPSFAQLLRDVPVGKWLDVSRKETAASSLVDSNNPTRDHSFGASDDEGVENDPDLSMYLWRGGKDHKVLSSRSISPKILTVLKIDMPEQATVPIFQKKKKKRNFVRVDL